MKEEKIFSYVYKIVIFLFIIASLLIFLIIILILFDSSQGDITKECKKQCEMRNLTFESYITVANGCQCKTYEGLIQKIY